VESAYGLVNDVLIALSARSIGATVITQNERDFAAIQTIRPFKMALVPESA
jgi:predicted nucleic acid-binding protein